MFLFLTRYEDSRPRNFFYSSTFLHPAFNPTVNSTVCNKQVRSPNTPSPVLKLKVRKHGTSWRLQVNNTLSGLIDTGSFPSVVDNCFAPSNQIIASFTNITVIG